MTASTESNTENRIIDLGLSLSYRHGLGAMTPFFEALLEGKALASRCEHCGDTRFPPRPICVNDHHPTGNITLSGEGTLRHISIGQASSLLDESGADHVFGDVVVDGVSNGVLARIVSGGQPLQAGMRVQLIPPKSVLRHPIQALVFAPV